MARTSRMPPLAPLRQVTSFRKPPVRRHGPRWAPVVALAVTVVLAGVVLVVRLLVGRHGPEVGVEGDGGAYAPEPLTGDPATVAPTDVAPV